jgi:hypothetical protein
MVTLATCCFVTFVDALVPISGKTCCSKIISLNMVGGGGGGGGGSVTARNGLSYEDVEVGTGRRVNKGDAILVYYEGTFRQPSGKKTVFDATEPGEPLEFVVGKGQLIPGMDLGIIGDMSLEIEPMKIGGDRKLKIPSALAYGNNQVGPIPPNQDLEFQISVINAQPATALSQSVKIKGIAAFLGTMGFFAVLGLFIAQNYQSWF